MREEVIVGSRRIQLVFKQVFCWNGRYMREEVIRSNLYSFVPAASRFRICPQIGVRYVHWYGYINVDTYSTVLTLTSYFTLLETAMMCNHPSSLLR